jgi:hypothetical protein
VLCDSHGGKESEYILDDIQRQFTGELTEYKSHITFAKALTLNEAFRSLILLYNLRVLIEIAMLGLRGLLPMYPLRVKASSGDSLSSARGIWAVQAME